VLSAPLPEPALRDDEIDAMLAKLHAGSARVQSAPEPTSVADQDDDISDTAEQPVLEHQTGARFESAAEAEDYEPVAYEDLPGEEENNPFERGRIVDEPPAPEERARLSPQPALRARVEQGLISPATSAAVDSAFNTLAQTVLVQNGRTLEDLVRELLRPMLKTWLDDNLPNMVERLVRAEIERVSRGRG
jgi:cell pole-organizing protein PopZ